MNEDDIVHLKDDDNFLIQNSGKDDDTFRDPVNMNNPMELVRLPKLKSDEEYMGMCPSLNTKQREILFSIVHSFKTGKQLPFYEFI